MLGPSEASPTTPPVAPLPLQASQPPRLGPNESSLGNNVFDVNAPYDTRIPAINENIFSSGMTKRMQHVAEELNSARSVQISASVPLHEAVKIALETLFGVSSLLPFLFSYLFFLYFPLPASYSNTNISF